MSGWVTQGAGDTVAHYSTEHFRNESVRAACGLTVSHATPAEYRQRHQECVKALQEALVEVPLRMEVEFKVTLTCNNGEEEMLRRRLEGTFARLKRVDGIQAEIVGQKPIQPDEA